MRLIHKVTRDLVGFVEEEVPPYIILSHRWHGAETTMKEFMEQRHLDQDQWCPGTAKIIRLCNEVAAYREEYVWIDTCCIDKTSSTELQEAINSMYRWYEQASVCLVYLDDVKIPHAASGEDDIRRQLAGSRWFTRGWTLQELIAPLEEIFLDVEWKRIGTRSELGQDIQEITGIRAPCFGNRAEVLSTTVAERMSWISLRQTTRTEDIAYCILGIFDVNMTMLYGEGSKAFLRLQKQIIEEIDDETIFLWLPVKSHTEDDVVPMLAPRAECFAFCRKKKIATDLLISRNTLRTTTKGLQVETFGERHQQFMDEYWLLLNCTIDGLRARIRLRRRRDCARSKINRLHRLRVSEVSTVSRDEDPQTPSGWNDYNEQLRKLAQTHAPSRFHAAVQNTSQARLSFETAVVLYTVFIE